ncbi:MAG: ABC transporter substrate-binding protein [Flavobacteriales bacterium]|nr:ABC transporter substrate-binding protein [Flavobacteriales bacterium]
MAVLLLVSVACTGTPEARHREGKGGKHYGGVFNANESDELRSLFPLSLLQASSHRIGAQLFEGLVRFDQSDLSVQPALAASWQIDASGTVYTFSLRKGVRFHDDPCFEDGIGREVQAADVVHCFEALCAFSELNQMFWLFQDKVLGANAHFAASANDEAPGGVKGLEVLDPYTLRITLLNPWPGFLQVLAHQGCWIWPKEAVEHYAKEVHWHPVGTGPFRLKAFRKGEALIMERNPHYWEVDEAGNRLPFLDAIRYTFLQDKGKELDEFEKGHLSVIYELPIDRTEILRTGADKGFQVQSVPGLTVQYYGFNMRKEPFKDKRIRQAFSLAIDRQLLVDSVLGGLAIAADRGVVPPGFSQYPYDTVPPTTYDPDKARALLAEAGHPDGKDLPAVFLQVNNNGFGYVRVAGVLQGMLERELGARVVSSVLPAEQHFDRVERGDVAFWREGWVADHPDPENFLALFYGKNAPLDSLAPATMNSTRYRNAEFDSLYVLAQRTTEPAERMLLLAKAERRLMSDVVVIPLYFERSIRLLQPWVMDLPINGMEYRALGPVWFDPARRPDH